MKYIKRIVILTMVLCLMLGTIGTASVKAEEDEFTISKKSISLQVGSKKKLTVSGADEQVVWTTSNKTVATVTTSGKVKARNAGTATITATAGERKAECTVNVSKKNIRVLIKTSGFSSVYHDSVTVSSTKKFTMTSGGEQKSYKAGKKVKIKTSDSRLKKGGSILVKAEDSGKVKITSISRSQGTPSYRGELVIKKVDGKGLTVVNHVPLEHYLYSVVNSEMSSSFSEEALKAQAVTARSFAYAHLNSSKYKSLEADLDDSNSYQVYNNIKEATSVKNAVNATKNKVIKEGSKVLATYFFSTSCGQTALPSEVWNFDGEDKYYNSVLQVKDGEYKDLSTNSKFKKFMNDKKTKTFDSGSAWYRWCAEVSKANLQKRINGQISSCCVMYPNYVKVLQSDGSYKSQSISTVGTLKNVTVSNREKSGLVDTIKITGTKATVKISHASAIRTLMAPVYDKLEKKDGTTSSGLTSLPSAFFYVEKKSASGSAVTYTISGGGFGHGVGMSQNGANQMAKDGFTYSQIIEHYYAKIKVKHVVD